MQDFCWTCKSIQNKSEVLYLHYVRHRTVPSGNYSVLPVKTTRLFVSLNWMSINNSYHLLLFFIGAIAGDGTFLSSVISERFSMFFI